MTDKRKLAEDLMVDIMYATAETLLEKIRNGTAQPQDISNAIKLLKNNGITVAVNKGNPLDILSEELPFHTEHMMMN